jgi:hypothetical protein
VKFLRLDISFSQGDEWKALISKYIGIIPVSGCILDNAEDCTPEQIAHELYDLDLDAVCRILAFASPTPPGPETIYIEPICDRCKHYADARSVWWDAEADAGCVENDRPNKPVTYIRADLFDAQVQRMEENALEYIDATGLRIADLTYLLREARDQLDAFGHAELIDEINEAMRPVTS